jgi:hypothetical protein
MKVGRPLRYDRRFSCAGFELKLRHQRPRDGSFGNCIASFRSQAALIALCAIVLPWAGNALQNSPKSETRTRSQRSQTKSDHAALDAGYVGSKACRSCHSEIYRSFNGTSMGQSMVAGDADSRAATLPTPATIYDANSNQYFEVTRQKGTLFAEQYSLDSSGKPAFRQDWKLDFVMGAGANGFSFLVKRGDYFFEAPLSYYNSTHSWSFSPGFELNNRGFTRPILDRCIVCHSGRPKAVAGQIGLFEDPPFGELAIGCENCHGPGGRHVVERTQENMVGLAPPQGGDATIVNPAGLSGWLADNICMRCHQGQDVRVEMPGKRIEDFRPGMSLGEFVSILKIAPAPDDNPSSLPLEHYFGMTLSKCYRASGNLHCITCHNPHEEVSTGEAEARYRAQCLRCHTDQSCRLSSAKRLATNPPDDCVSCHMPKRVVSTISHAALTDHSIPARLTANAESPRQNKEASPADLLLLTAPPDRWTRLQSLPRITLFLAYESLVREGHSEFRAKLEQLLPGVETASSSDPIVLRALARAEFGKNTAAATQQALDHMTRLLRLTSPNVDDYIFLANLYSRTGQDKKAIALLDKGITNAPYFRDLYEMLAEDYMAIGQYGDATRVLKQGLSVFPVDLKLRALEQKANSAILNP